MNQHFNYFAAGIATDKMQLSIIIVNYNVKFFLEQCLCSVKSALANFEAEVVVVDNCSSDGSQEYLPSKFPWIKFIPAETNEGFAKANNMALKHCTGDYVLYLNPDTIISEDILQHCIDFFKINKDAAAVGVRMLDGSGNFLPESKRAFPSPMVSFYKLSGLSSLFPGSGVFNKYALGNLSENEIHETDVLCGAFIMAERKMLNDINGFDEAFFMYGEDIDLCYRIQKAGKKIYYLGTETIIHFKGESSLSDNRKYVRIFYEAMFVFVNKHYSGANAALIKFFLQTGIMMRSTISFITMSLRKSFKKIKQGNGGSGKKFLLIGDNAGMEEARHIFESNQINTVKSSLDYTINTGEDAVVVLCTGRNFTYKNAIEHVQQNGNRIMHYWHGSESGSIVGSANKNLTGSVYSI